MGRFGKRIRKLEGKNASSDWDEVRLVWRDDVDIPEGNPKRWRDADGVLHIRLEWGSDEDDAEGAEGGGL